MVGFNVVWLDLIILTVVHDSSFCLFFD